MKCSDFVSSLFNGVLSDSFQIEVFYNVTNLGKPKIGNLDLKWCLFETTEYFRRVLLKSTKLKYMYMCVNVKPCKRNVILIFRMKGYAV